MCGTLLARFVAMVGSGLALSGTANTLNAGDLTLAFQLVPPAVAFVQASWG